MRDFPGNDSLLAHWWRERAEVDIEMTIPKAIEYGSRDLIDMGRDAASILGREGVSEAEAIEIGIWFYVRGKMARWTAALRRGEQVSNDTIFDIGIYTKMMQRVREVGSWPGDIEILDDNRGMLVDPQYGPSGAIDVSGFDQRPILNHVHHTDAAGNCELDGCGYNSDFNRGADDEMYPVTDPGGEAELATADQRVEAMRAIHEFRQKLKRRGFREFNAVGELIHDTEHLKVATQYESMGDWRVRVWHHREQTVSKFLPRDKVREGLAELELIEWRSSK